MPLNLSFRDLHYLNFVEGLTCDIEAGTSVLIITSREDESTALTRLITGMCPPTRGSVLVNGQDVAGLQKGDLHLLRRQIGVVPSKGGLIANLKVWENITLPLLYHAGGITSEEEKHARECLVRLGYSGNIMALPAHLSHFEKLTAVLVRTFLVQPSLVIYSNCIDVTPPASRDVFFQISKEFHTAVEGRTSLYLTSSPELATNLPVDMVLRVNESV